MTNYEMTPGAVFTQLLMRNHPGAIAWVRGGEQHPDLSGAVKFYHKIMGEFRLSL